MELDDDPGAAAYALHTLSTSRYEAGDLPGALEASRQALEIAMRTPEDNETVSLAYTSLALCQCRLGEWPDARDSLRLAVAQTEPGTDLRADQLTRLRDVQDTLGEQAEALATTTELVATTRKLAADDPDRLLEVASGLIDLGTRLHGAQDYEAALQAMVEAASLLRSAGSSVELGDSLHNAAVIARILGRTDEALASAREAAETFQLLYDDDPDQAWALTRVLTFLGSTWEASGQFDQAITSMERALGLLERIYQPDDADDVLSLASLLHNLSRYHEIEKRLARSLTLMRRAVSLYSDLAEADPDRFRPRLADAWVSLGVYLWHTDELEEACTAAQLAVDLCRAAGPTGDGGSLAHALAFLSDRTAALGDLPGAVELLQEAQEILEELATRQPDPYLARLALIRDVLAGRVAEAGAAGAVPVERSRA